MGIARYLLGIDNGGTVTKAALYDSSGVELAVASVKSEIRFPVAGHAEKDVDELWAANVRVIGDAARKARIDPGEIAGVAVTGHGNGMYLTTVDGRPAYNGINSADSRAMEYVERWYKDGTFERVLPRTCQSIWAAQPACLLAWFSDHDPRALERTRWIFMCKDYIRYRLTGEAFAELTDYSGTSLMNVRQMRYDPQVVEAFGIPQVLDKLPPIRKASEMCGRVTRAAAEETGLREGTPVAGGLFDIVACAIATGITDPEKLCLIAGSWSINEYISPAPVESRDLFMCSAYCMPGYWLISESSATSASNLEWYVSELMAGERAEAEARGGSVYEACNALVHGVKPEASDVVFLPFLYGSNAGPKASACFLGLHGWHGKPEMLRAVYEGVVFSHKTHVDRLLGFRERPTAARIAGGAAKSEVWVQMFADVLQLPIEITESEELGALGAAICAGICVGMFASYEEAVSRMVRISRTVRPNQSLASLYQAKYARYQCCIDALSAAWQGGGAA
ncbi:MAG: FGGY-family carbohydrate kinase [Spirochaetia bacterium]|jgi:L-xylulokinase